MSAALRHSGLPRGKRRFDLMALVKFTANLADRKDRISKTAVALLDYLVDACREDDFRAGRMCGVWEQPATIAAKLGISTKVYHDAEAELRRRGLVSRTYNAHAKRDGERRNGVIARFCGLNLAPLIDSYGQLELIKGAIELKQQAARDLRFEIGQIRRRIREMRDDALIELAETILPRGQASKITQIEKLEAIKADFLAALALVDLPSGDTKSCQQTEEIVSPIIPPEDLSKTRSDTVRRQTPVADHGTVTPETAARLASEDYRALLAVKGKPSWQNLIETSATACSWLGIDQRVWGDACHQFGRERAALCVLIIDRNRTLPRDHRYRASRPAGCLSGMLGKGAADLNLLGMLRVAESYPAGPGVTAEAELQNNSQWSMAGAKQFGHTASRLMANVEIAEPGGQA